MTIQVLLVTDVRLYAEGISKALREGPSIAAVAVAPDCAAALGELRRAPADVAILDLAAIDDVAQARAFAAAARPAHVVALAVRDSDREVVAWAEHGVTGILTREATFEELRQAVLAAARDECDCSPRVATALRRRVAEVAAERRAHTPDVVLTDRETEIAALLVEGLSNKEIAARLLLGLSTVKNHVHNVLGKLEAHTRAEAVAHLVAWGIQAPPAEGSGSRVRMEA